MNPDSQWYPCSELTPPSRDPVLLAWVRRPKDREEPTMRTGFFREFSAGGRYVGSNNVNFEKQPTHWRILPRFFA